MNALSIVAELRARAGELGWFVLEMHDPIAGAVTRLGLFDASSPGHSDISISWTRTRNSGERRIFADNYQRDRVQGGRVDASIFITRMTSRLRIEGVEVHQKDLLRASVKAESANDLEPNRQMAPVTWRDDDEAYAAKI